MPDKYLIRGVLEQSIKMQEDRSFDWSSCIFHTIK